MLAHKKILSHILISTDIEFEAEKLVKELRPNRVVTFVRDDFKIEDAKDVLAESYISESSVKYIILAAQSFNSVSQNSLLKILEEPPKNIEFIIISPTKSNLLSTICSRLPVKKGKISHDIVELNLNLAKIDYAEIFSFLKNNARIKKSEAKDLVEALYFRATVVDMLILSQKQLENFETAYKLLELNSRPQSVLSMILMSFVGENNVS